MKKQMMLVGIISSVAGLISCASPSFAWGCFAEHHPRRAEVLRRDNFLNREIRFDRGDLSGHYGQLINEDRAIRRQEQWDAYRNGGYITPGQQMRLNREENAVQRQINRDFRF